MKRFSTIVRRTFLILSFFFLGLVPGKCDFWYTINAIICFFSTPNVYFNSFGHGNMGSLIHVSDSGYVLVEPSGSLCDLMVYDIVSGSPDLNDITYRFVQDVGNIIIGDLGTIYRKPPIGSNGELIPNPAGTQDLYEINQDLPSANVIAVGDSGVILKSTDHGLSWEVVVSPVSENLRAGEIRGNYIAVGGEGYSLYQSSDDGSNWEQIFIGDKITTEGPAYFNAIFFYDDNVGYVGGTGGYMGKTTDGGVTWNPRVAPDFDEINDILFISPDSGAVVGSNGTVRFTTDGGDTWEEDPDLTNALDGKSIKKVRSLDNTLGIAIGDSGLVVYFSTDSISVSVDEKGNNIQNYSLSNNYPNPFNPSTIIKYSLPYYGFVTLRVYDMLGREIATLVNEEKPPGTYEANFDASNLATGIYFYKLQVGSFVETKKMILLK